MMPIHKVGEVRLSEVPGVSRGGWVEMRLQGAHASLLVMFLLAYSVVYGKEIDIDFAQRILAGRIKVERKNVTIDQIISTTCEHFNVKEEDIFSKSRKAEIVTVRQMSMYLAHKHTKLTASKIGIYVGNRDHATVLHGIKAIDGRLKKDKKLRRHLEELEEKLIGKAL